MTMPVLTNIRYLAHAVRGPVLTPEDAEFELEIAGFNASAHHTPEIVVGVLDADDVVQTVRWATHHHLPIEVQATGHGAVVSFDRGVLVSTRRMQDLQIDPQTRIARIGAGVKWKAVIDAAAQYGLAPLNGSSSDVGAVGYTLGGGLPVLGRTFGFASDFVRGFEIVTADGRLRTVSEHEEPDLFWALRGGKANLGVVTSFLLELVPVSTIYGGCIFFSGEHTQGLLDAYGEWTRSLPESTTTALKLMRLPPMPGVPEPLQGKLTVQLVVAHVGDPAEGERLLEPMRRIAPPIIDAIQEMSYSQIDSIHGDPEHPIPVKETCLLLEDLTPAAIRDLVSAAGPESNCPLLMLELRHLGGALKRTPGVPDAVGSRDAGYCLTLLGVLMPPIADLIPTALRGVVETMTPHSTGHTFVNLHGTPSSFEDRARPWAKDVHGRLLRIKAEIDPHDTFRFAHSLSDPRPRQVHTPSGGVL